MFKVKQFDILIERYVIRSKRWLLVYDVFKHVLLLVLLCHMIGSFFFYIDVLLISWNWYPENMLWVHRAPAYDGIYNLTTVGRYCYSFYFAIVTLSGEAYGDITPLNPT
jgi:hypothetical protein